MTDYTPGPWRTIDDAQGPCMIMHPTKDGVAIASLTNSHLPSKGFHDHGKEWPKERNANAELIASAPRLKEERDELLEARKG